MLDTFGMLNPFALQGPGFLAFYTVFGIALLWNLNRGQRRQEAGDVAHIGLSDPYLIACLRGGSEEAVRVAVFSLVDRGLLKAEDRWVQAVDSDAVHRVDTPLDKALLVHFATSGLADAAASDYEVRAAVRELEEDLVRLGLLPSAAQEKARLRRLGAALGFLGVAGLAKLAVALNDEPYDPYAAVFLVVLMLVLTGMAGRLFGGRRTAAGNDVLASVRELFQGLRSRRDDLKPGGSGAVTALLAAVYGLSVLPGDDWAFADKLFLLPRRKPESSGSGSSCGACGGSAGESHGSDDSSCGGGDGGGSGDGGGCGGCGGD